MKKRPPLYGVWATMLSRCRNPSATSYKNYGGRGIKVYKAWEEYPRFHAWAIKSGYKLGLEIDRVDVNGNYCPRNCRWVKRLNNRNKRSNCYIVAWGEKKEMAAWADDVRCVVTYGCLKHRIERGIDAIEAMTHPAVAVGKYPRKKVLHYYLAGAMRGHKDLNVKAFRAAVKRLRSLGFRVFSPAEKGIEKQAVKNEALQDNLSFRRKVFRLDTSFICTHADAVAVLPNSEASLGVRAEIALAKAIGLPVKMLTEEYTHV